MIGGTDATFAASAVLPPSTAEAAYAVGGRTSQLGAPGTDVPVPNLSPQAPRREPSARAERKRA